jgi:hypothetical protein
MCRYLLMPKFDVYILMCTIWGLHFDVYLLMPKFDVYIHCDVYVQLDVYSLMSAFWCLHFDVCSFDFGILTVESLLVDKKRCTEKMTSLTIKGLGCWFVVTIVEVVKLKWGPTKNCSKRTIQMIGCDQLSQELPRMSYRY